MSGRRRRSPVAEQERRRRAEAIRRRCLAEARTVASVAEEEGLSCSTAHSWLAEIGGVGQRASATDLDLALAVLECVTTRPLTLDEIAAAAGCCRENIRRLEQAALRKLRGLPSPLRADLTEDLRGEARRHG